MPTLGADVDILPPLLEMMGKPFRGSETLEKREAFDDDKRHKTSLLTQQG